MPNNLDAKYVLRYSPPDEKKNLPFFKSLLSFSACNQIRFWPMPSPSCFVKCKKLVVEDIKKPMNNINRNFLFKNI